MGRLVADLVRLWERAPPVFEDRQAMRVSRSRDESKRPSARHRGGDGEGGHETRALEVGEQQTSPAGRGRARPTGKMNKISIVDDDEEERHQVRTFTECRCARRQARRPHSNDVSLIRVIRRGPEHSGQATPMAPRQERTPVMSAGPGIGDVGGRARSLEKAPDRGAGKIAAGDGMSRKCIATHCEEGRGLSDGGDQGDARRGFLRQRWPRRPALDLVDLPRAVSAR